MNRSESFANLDPVAATEVDRVSSRPAFTALMAEIVATPPDATPAVDDNIDSLGLRDRPRRVRPSAAIAIVCAIILLAGVVIDVGQGGSGKSTGTDTTGHALSGRGGAPTHVQTGTWKLMDDALSGTWQQNLTGGPPPGRLSCPSASVCYAMSGHYSSPNAGSPLLSESLYVTRDQGASWTELAMPQGFDPTSQLTCGNDLSCEAGGTESGQPVFLSTADGGQAFSTTRLPVGAGHLDTLSCLSATFCAGLAAPSEALGLAESDATFLSTDDGGKTFTDRQIVPGDSMASLVCSSISHCTVVGVSDELGPNDATAGVAAKTTDGGRSWTSATFPAGFGINSFSQLSCVDALHCSVTGLISITVQNPPQCASVHEPPLPPGATTTTTTSVAPSAAVQRVAQEEESAAAASANQNPTNGFSCDFDPRPLVGDIASTTDGGLSWTPDPMPANVPNPQFSGLSCPTVTQCWATGTESVPVQIGNTFDGGSSMVLGTTDGGSNWSRVTFSIPSSAPNYYGQSYISIGSISCPTAGSCVALGEGAQSAPSTPAYSFTTSKN